MSVTPLRPKFPIARSMPLSVGVLHFIGIGGIGMSGIAEILHSLGYRVQGTDLAESANVERLRGLGIHVAVGHAAAHLKDAAVVVISSAVKDDNPEVLAARAARIPVVKRAEMLAEIMRLKMAVAVAGTHGKTTTTSLMAALFDAAKLEPTVINGGIINAYGTNARVGKGEWIVAEADESDGTFIKLPATVAVVTNIDPEHLDHFGTFDNLRATFQQFVENLPFYGFGVLCIDHPEVQALIGRVRDRRVISYGLSPQAEVRGVNIRREPGGQRFDIEADGASICDVFLPMHGEHNVRNALAVASVARELSINPEVVKEAFAKFGGVKRRFTRTGEAGGITVIDDYGHHPVEIAATLKAARESLEGTGGRVIAVVQPHRYTRLRDLFPQFCTAFNDADIVVVTNVYSAGEEPIAGINRDALVQGLQSGGHRKVLAIEGHDGLAELLLAEGAKGDLAVCLGAGSISKWANGLPKEMEAVINARRKKA